MVDLAHVRMYSDAPAMLNFPIVPERSTRYGIGRSANSTYVQCSGLRVLGLVSHVKGRFFFLQNNSAPTGNTTAQQSSAGSRQQVF